MSTDKSENTAKIQNGSTETEANQSKAPEKRLIINLDVNGTILAEDSAKGEGSLFGALKMIAETLEHEDWKIVAKDGTITKDYKTYVETIHAALKKSDVKQYNEKVQEMLSKLTQPEFIVFIGEEKHVEINKAVEKIIAQTGLFSSYQNLFKSLEQSKKPYTIVFHTFGKDVKKVRDTVATLVGMDRANQMPYVSFPSIKENPRANLIQVTQMPDIEQLKELLYIENAVFLIKDELYFGYQNSNQISKIIETPENTADISQLKQHIQAHPDKLPANKTMRKIINSIMRVQDPQFALQSRAMRVHAPGAIGHAVETKGGTDSKKPKPPESDITGYYPVKEVKEIIDYFVQHKLVFAKDSYKEWVKGQLEKGVFTHLGAKPFITGSAENTINFFFDDNVKKRILSVIKDTMLTINEKSTKQDKEAAIQEQTTWVKELVEAGTVVSVPTYEAAVDDDYFINSVNKVLLKMGETPLLKTQELQNNEKLKADLKIYEDKFIALLAEIKITRDDLILKSKTNPEYKVVQESITTLYSTLKTEMGKFFEKPSAQQFHECHKNCKSVIDNATKESANHRGWHAINRYARAALGLLTVILGIIPALVIESKYGFSQTFWAKPDTKTSKKIGLFSQKFQSQKESFEQEENEVSKDINRLKP